MNKERVERHSRKGVEGRAHREEAFLMQMVGVQNDTGEFVEPYSNQS